MKLHKALTLIFTIVILTSTLSLTCVEARRYRPKTIYKDFSLTAKGEAYDKYQRKMVPVSINLQGTAKTRGNTWKISIKGGNINIGDRKPIFVYKGTATLIPKYKYINLHIFTQSQYGYQKTVWNLKGKACEIADDQFEAMLKAKRVYLPLKYYPKLMNLKLETKITLT